ncbi:two-component system, NtrC family, C4-dicarboxylate transport sensor histidine kinase DctB [Devosia lucknowensis]|uniref:C4-dicarboxylate transport sensor protein DctB n=1 Tax=Devosia lucknowensis TaxID=1096929 RepID=A0A1Y6G7Z6_9HYPH|nr:ATP-binding protein [Devosia lucknowensis]SMQ85453.1 two-component system, NtrC family, C4-dicarboxylate transport sensor histidine kinase DctB [Devosia lucknowensis]
MRAPYWVALMCLVLAVPVATVSFRMLTEIYFNQAASRADDTLGLAVSALQGQLDRYRKLPQLLAELQDIRDLAANPGDADKIVSANAYLEATSDLLEASDIYVMTGDGTTIAASNHASEASFIGETFDYRPYFTDAIAGRDGSFFALGTTSLRRGYYFSAPIINADRIDGVLAIKVDIDAIENSWRSGDTEIIVSDPEGIIFMSGRSEWLFASLEPLTQERLDRTGQTRRYADAELVELPAALTRTKQGHSLLSFLDGDPAPEYLSVSQPMPEAGWTVRVLLDASPARAEALITTLLLLSAMAVVTMGVIVWMQRRMRLAERLAMQAEAREQLERRVAERTTDLGLANSRLEAEVVERRNAEEKLRKTQADLVQAGKLAALGQMSAALSHEFNQPLAAVRSYADSALVMIDRDRTGEVRQYVERIGGLTEKMTTISRHLSNFARKPGEQLRPVDLDPIVADALAILDWRVRDQVIVVTTDLADCPLAQAGSVRLQQVLVNILSNAFDAIEGREKREVAIAARQLDGRIALTVADTGPGVPAGVIDRIFDPFFSTKGVGRGLGLGLSISYNIVKDFGGDLTVRNAPAGGAVFTILLEPAESRELEPAQ